MNAGTFQRSRAHPFSMGIYYRNNKSKFAVLTLTVLLGVLLLYVVNMVIGSMEESLDRSTLEPKRHYSAIHASNSFLSEDTLQEVDSWGLTQKIIPMVEYTIPMRLNVGGVYGTSMLIVKQDEMKYLMELLDLELIAGGFPRPGYLEVMLHEDVAKNLGIGIGDRIGSGLNSNVFFPEEYSVVGLVRGQPLVSFAHLNIDYAKKYSVLMVPKEGSIDVLNQRLEDLKSSKVRVSTYPQEQAAIGSTMGSIHLLITAISLTVIIIVSSCSGFLCYIYYIQRRKEFGLVWALGYTRQEVINRTFMEIMLINLSGYALGFILSIVTGLVLNLSFFGKLGQPLPLYLPDSILISACVPVFSAFFCLVPVWQMHKRFSSAEVLDAI